jgi:DNA processing protein
MEKDVDYYLGFSHFLGIGPMKFQALLKHFGTVKKAYEGERKEIKKVTGEKIGEKFVDFRAKFDPGKKMDELTKKGIRVIPLLSRSYPKSLQNISDPPICLYVRGNISFDSATQFLSHESLPAKTRALESEKIAFASSKLKSSKPVSSPFPNSPIFFAIVGTRKPTPYGEQVTKKFAHELAEAGFIIVSGMAMGIDAVAHWAALEAGGKTIAVLGCGVDIIYPAVNRRLYEKIVDGGGVVISEFPPGQLVQKGLFIARNRIISGLSSGVLVVEGAQDSGALITARYAGEQGKEVFAPPGPITSQMSAAPNILLKQGAKLVTSVEDIFEELGLRLGPKKKEEISLQLTPEEKIVFDLLEKRPLSVDEIVVASKQSVNKILNLVSFLEIKGIIEKNSGGKHQIKLS